MDVGDWAAVSATAALLAGSDASDCSASGSFSSSLSSESQSARSTAFSMSRKSAGRVQELDRMVIGGD